MPKKEKESPSLLPIIKEIMSWNTSNILELAPLLIKAQEMCEDNKQNLEDVLSIDDVPTAPLPENKNLREVWAIDKGGMCLRRAARGRLAGTFQVVGVKDLPDSSDARSYRIASKAEVTLALRITPELNDRIELSMKRSFEPNKSAWARKAFNLRLAQEETTNEGNNT